MDKADVEKCKADFHTFADEIRVNVPSLIVAAMETIHEKYLSLKAGRKGSFATAEIAKTEAVSWFFKLIIFYTCALKL